MKRGFTVIEVLTVLGIIVIVAAISYPAIASAKEAARQTACGSNLKQLWTSIQLYRGDQDQHAETGGMVDMGLPTHRAFDVLFDKLGVACPESKGYGSDGYLYMPNDPQDHFPIDWSEYTQRAEGNAVVLADVNHNSDQTMKMTAFPKLGIGLTMSGSLIKRRGDGDPYLIDWWLRHLGDNE